MTHVIAIRPLDQEGAPVPAWFSQDIFSTLSGFIYISSPSHSKGVEGDLGLEG